jgi:hypothetical protein
MSEILTAYKSIDEAPEAEKPYLKETEGGIIYDNTGLKNTVESQRRAEREARAEAERYRNQLEALKNESEKQSEKKADTAETKKSAEADKIAELEKGLELMKSERERERLENLRMRLHAQVKEAIAANNMQDKAFKTYKDDFDFDESGKVFVKDEDGKPKLNPATGERLSISDYLKEEAKADPWLLKNSASGTGASGTGLRGAVNQVAASAAEIRTMKEDYRKAQMAGNVNLVQKLLITAAEKGITLC